MRSVRSTSVRWTAVVVTALAVLVACHSSEPSGPTSDEASEFRKGGGKGLGQSAFFVGNFSPEGTTNGILRYNGRGSFIDRMVPEGSGGLTIGCCMAFGPDENLYVGSPLTANVLRYNGVTGEFIDEFIPSGSGGLVVPLTLVFRDGRLYVGDLGTRSIRRYNALTGAPIAGGTFIETAAQGTGDGDPQLFEFGSDGNVYVASTATDRVLRYNGSTGRFLDEFVPAGPNGVVAPVGLTFGPDGNLYVASSESGDVLRYDGRTGEFIDEFVPAGRGGITGPRVIAFKSTITVCHRPPGNPGRGKTLTIGYLVGRTHVVGHGDTIGRCART